MDSVHITLTPNTGWPQQTGITEPTGGGKAVRRLCGDGHGHLCGVQLWRCKAQQRPERLCRPALAAGKSRFVLYNRSGNELRVESRTQNLYTKTLDSSIYLCAWRMPGRWP